MAGISGIGTNSANFGQTQNKSVNDDSELKSIQKQIENVQKELQSLSSNDKMSEKEKTNKRKELQQQLQDLNNQASQRRMEIQQEKREKATVNSKGQGLVQKTAENSKNMDLSIMNGIINSDTSKKQAAMLHSVQTGMEGKAGVLKSQIKTDKGRGGSTYTKEAELSNLNGQINGTASRMMSKISNINKKIVNLENETKNREEQDLKDTDNNDSLSKSVGKNLKKIDLKIPSADTIKAESKENLFQAQEKGQYINTNL